PDVIVDAATPCLAQLTAAFERTGSNILALEAVPDSESHKYGVITPGDRDGRLVEVQGMVEKPPQGTAPSNLAMAGRYVLRPEIFGALSRHETGAGGEIQLTDAMARLMGEQPFHGWIYEGDTYDCGDKIGLLRANVALAL